MPNYPDLMQNPSRQAYEDAVLSVLESPEELKILFNYFTTGSTTDRNRSAWLLHHISDGNPNLFVPHHAMLLAHAKHAKTDAEKRFIARLFAKHGLPNGEKLHGLLLKQAFDWLLEPKESIAVKANCLDILHQFCKIHPEIENELRTIIAEQFKNSTAAFKVRAKRILNDLNPLKPI
jgi:hypothetical protein